MKNSEWGAVAYLSQSKYGLNGTNIYINNVNLKNSTTSVYAVTGKDNKNIEQTEDDLDIVGTANYLKNTKIYGDAIRETSTAGTGSTSWYSDNSCFQFLNDPFTIRSGMFWSSGLAGLFCFNASDGRSHFGCGFRAVLVTV